MKEIFAEEVCFSATCGVCGQPFAVGDEIEFKIRGPLSLGTLPYNRFIPLHTVCGQAHAQILRRLRDERQA